MWAQANTLVTPALWVVTPGEIDGLGLLTTSLGVWTAAEKFDKVSSFVFYTDVHSSHTHTHTSPPHTHTSLYLYLSLPKFSN